MKDYKITNRCSITTDNGVFSIETNPVNGDWFRIVEHGGTFNQDMNEILCERNENLEGLIEALQNYQMMVKC